MDPEKKSLQKRPGSSRVKREKKVLILLFPFASSFLQLLHCYDRPCLQLPLISVRLGLDFARNLCHSSGQHHLAAGHCPAHNKSIKMDGLYSAAYVNLGYFPLSCLLHLPRFYPPATYACRCCRMLRGGNNALRMQRIMQYENEIG